MTRANASLRRSDGVTRCWWATSDPLYIAYHDDEWGRPVGEDAQLFEKLVLEGFQSGLSWLTILRKREEFRRAFRDFDPERVARFGAADVRRLLGNASIVRHRGKIEAAIQNAIAVRTVQQEVGSLAAHIWRFAPSPRTHPAPRTREAVLATTAASIALARDLRQRGFRFLGPTTVYAFMQAMGLVNDHLVGCSSRVACARERLDFPRPQLPARPPVLDAPQLRAADSDT